MDTSYNRFFEGCKYDVPLKLKETAIAIMKRFTIDGLCDGMYICNTIAYEGGTGDGMGTFESDEIKNIPKVARYLQHAYGSNIFKEDISELEEILTKGKINSGLAVLGIERFIQKCKTEKKTCDDWRKNYLDKCIETAKKNLLLLN